jgi:hypothetical protein
MDIELMASLAAFAVMVVVWITAPAGIEQEAPVPAAALAAEA